MLKEIKNDLDTIMQKDPAARSRIEVLLTYGGIKALMRYRVAHALYKKNFKLIARIISTRARHITGIEIHPAATIGKGLFIDHGSGVVIGETTEIGDNVTLYQGVTLGGTGKEMGKRHPTVHDNVMISAGAKVLGAVEIGEGSKIGAGSVVLKDIPPHCTVVGVPGRIVRQHGEKVTDMDQKLPDPVLEEFMRINKRLTELEEQLHIKACRYSIAMAEDEANLDTTSNTENQQD